MWLKQARALVGFAAFSAIVLGGNVAAAAPANLSTQDIADANCVAAISVLMGQQAADDTLSDVDKSSVTSLLTYFVGKLKGRHPDMKLAEVITAEFYAAMAPRLAGELQRCSTEAIALGKELEVTGKLLEGS